MPGRFAETLDSCRLRRQPRHFFSGKNSDLGAGSAGLRCRAGGRSVARWVPVGGLRGSAGQVRQNFRQWFPTELDFFSWEEFRPWRGLRRRAGGALGIIEATLGKPSNEVGRLGEPVLSLGEPLSQGLHATFSHFHSGPHCLLQAAPAGAVHVPARHIYLHCACSAHLLQVPARHCACSAHLPTSARHVLARPCACSARPSVLAPARHVLVLLGTAPPPAKFSRTDT